MHDCLKIAEIALMIAQVVLDLHTEDKAKKIGQGGEGYKSMHPLVSMGLTCKVLWDPAMRVLWADLESVKPLRVCFLSNFGKPRSRRRLVCPSYTVLVLVHTNKL